MDNRMLFYRSQSGRRHRLQLLSSCAVLVVMCLIPYATAANILFIPLPFRSHCFEMMQLSEAVTRHYNHTAEVIVPEHVSNSSDMRNFNNNFIVAKKYSKIDLERLENNSINSAFTRENLGVTYEILENYSRICDLLLTDKDLYRYLKTKQYDVAVIDNFSNAPCVSILAYKLAIPYIHTGRYISFSSFRLPISLSTMQVQEYFTDPGPMPMTFFNRVFNTITYYALSYVMPDVFNVHDAVTRYAPEKPFMSISKLRANVQLHLMKYDVLLDLPVSFPPNYVSVGGYTTKPTKPLNGILAEFMDKAREGVVLVSFGSQIATFPPYFIEKLRGTFQQMRNISFVVKIVGHKFQEDNVLSMQWTPQNDILGHNNTKAFVTHCGNRGQFEALYNGVPMIGLPLFGDQFYNAYRINMKGFGLQLNVLTFTSSDLNNAIMEVTSNPKYGGNIRQASEIFKNRPQNPMERATFWIDHVIKYGGEKMRAYEHDVPLYQYHLLDVFSFIIFCILLVCVVIYICMKKVFSLCFQKKIKVE